MVSDISFIFNHLLFCFFPCLLCVQRAELIKGWTDVTWALVYYFDWVSALSIWLPLLHCSALYWAGKVVQICVLKIRQVFCIFELYLWWVKLLIDTTAAWLRNAILHLLYGFMLHKLRLLVFLHLIFKFLNCFLKLLLLNPNLVIWRIA